MCASLLLDECRSCLQHSHVGFKLLIAVVLLLTALLTAVKASVLRLRRHLPVDTCHSCSVPSLHKASRSPGHSAAADSSMTLLLLCNDSWATTAASTTLIIRISGSVPATACISMHGCGQSTSTDNQGNPSVCLSNGCAQTLQLTTSNWVCTQSCSEWGNCWLMVLCNPPEEHHQRDASIRHHCSTSNM